MMPTALRYVLPLLGGAAALGVFGVDHGRAIAVATVMVLAWLLESLHPALVGFIGSFLFRATEAAEFETAFGGFATALPWMLFGVLLLVMSVEQGGLARAAGWALPSSLTTSPAQATLAIVVPAIALAWAIPHPLARAAVLIALVCAMTPAAGDQRARLGAIAAIGSLVFSRAGSAADLIVVAGSAVALFVGALLILRRPVTDTKPSQPEASPVDPAVAAIAALAVILWASAAYHRLPAEMIGLAAGLLCAIVAIIRGWRNVTADPLAMILAGTALSIPGVLIETGAVVPLANGMHQAVASLGLPPNLTDYWTWSALRLFMLDGGAAIEGLAPAASVATGAAATTLIGLHQAPSLALALAICGARARDIVVLGGAVFAVRSALLLLM